MSIYAYILAIIALLLILTGLAIYAVRAIKWPIFNQFLGRLKNPRKRALLVVNESKKCLRHLHKQLQKSHKTPELAEEIVKKMKHLLPVEAILIREQSRLYDLVQNIRRGFYNTDHAYRHSQKFSNDKKKNAANLVSVKFNTLIRIHSKLDKLNYEAKEQQSQIDTLLHLAEKYKTAQHYTRLASCLKTAEKVQQQNIKLLKAIHNAEKDLVVISKNLANIKK